MQQMKAKAGSQDYEPEVEPFFVMYQPAKAGTYKINIHSGIHSPDQFMYAIQALDAADEMNDVEISLQCPGGSLDSTDLLIHHMRKCEGHIHIIASGNCSSAASLVLLEADSFELTQNFSSTIHCGSLGFGGNFNEFRQQTIFSNKFMERVMRESYAGFLSESELDALLDGKDIVLDAEGWYNRSLTRMEYFKTKAQAQEAEQQAAIIAQMEADMAEKPTKKPRKTPIAHIS